MKPMCFVKNLSSGGDVSFVRFSILLPPLVTHGTEGRWPLPHSASQADVTSRAFEMTSTKLNPFPVVYKPEPELNKATTSQLDLTFYKLSRLKWLKAPNSSRRPQRCAAGRGTWPGS